MANFIVTFRLEDGTDYRERYDSLMEQLAIVSNGGSWDETSSFAGFTSSKSLEEVYSALYLESRFSPSKDTMVIIDLTNSKKKTCGLIEYPNTLSTCLGF